MMDAALPAQTQSKCRITRPPMSEYMSTTTSGHCSRRDSSAPCIWRRRGIKPVISKRIVVVGDMQRDVCGEPKRARLVVEPQV
jgi:hypothetical protein